MSNVTAIVDTYLAMWNETAPTRRAGIIQLGGDGRNVDLQLETEGHTAIGDMVTTVQARFPGHRSRRTRGVDAHHDQLRFGWGLAAPDGRVVVTGVDIGGLAPDGRLQRITGFFGDLPEKASA